MVKTSFEDTYPWSNSNRWLVTISVDTMKWVIKAYDEGLIEAQSDLDSLKSENVTLIGMKETLEDNDTRSAGGTPGKGPPPRQQSDGSEKKKYNKLPPDQYQDLRNASEAIVKKCRIWLGSAGGGELKERGKLGALCRRYLFMAGYSGQSTSEQQEYANLDETKKNILMTLTKASDKDANQKQQFVDETIKKWMTWKRNCGRN